MSWRRVARVAGLALAMGLVGTGSAAAAAPAGNAAFTMPGVQVYPESSVGIFCTTFGACDGVAQDLDRRAIPQYLSTRAGEAVLVTCQSAGVARVVGYFGRGEDVVTGWANVNGLRLRGEDSAPPCGMLV